jgi:hypothetical protein
MCRHFGVDISGGIFESSADDLSEQTSIEPSLDASLMRPSRPISKQFRVGAHFGHRRS